LGAGRLEQRREKMLPEETLMKDSSRKGEHAEASAETKHNKAIIRLAELIHHLHTDEDREKALHNLENLIEKEFSGEILPLMDRIARWDNTGFGTFLYAKAALQKNQPKLARKILEPVLKGKDADERAILLGARISARLKEADEANELLKRIKPGSSLSKGVEEVKARLSQFN
jgi:thioredoxin-like negative regulator of GroEL